MRWRGCRRCWSVGVPISAANDTGGIRVRVRRHATGKALVAHLVATLLPAATLLLGCRCKRSVILILKTVLQIITTTSLPDEVEGTSYSCTVDIGAYGYQP